MAIQSILQSPNRQHPKFKCWGIYKLTVQAYLSKYVRQIRYVSIVLCHLRQRKTKPTKWHVTKRKLWSALISAQSYQSLRGLHEESLGPYIYTLPDSDDWSDWADAQADLNLRWAHMPFCWFCHALVHLHFFYTLYSICIKNTLYSITYWPNK